jgi:UDP-glucose 4-epimerase
LYSAVADLLGFSGKPIYGFPRAGDIRHSLADISRATKEIGYEPVARFHDGLQKTVAWYLNEKKRKEAAAL